MNEKITYSKHTAAISAIYILGNAVIKLPGKSTDEFVFLGFLLSAVFLLAAYFIVSPICVFFIGAKSGTSIFRKTLSVIFLVATSVFALFIAANTFSEFIYFISKVVLPKSSNFFVVLIFGATAIYFHSRRQENVLKFSLVSFVLVAAIIIFFFFASIWNFNFKNVLIFYMPSFKELYHQAQPYIKNPLLASLILPVYYVFCFGESRTRDGFCGMLAGEALLGICIVTSVLLFGTSLAGSLDFPFSSAVSTVTVGRLFTRLDGFSYFIYFACALIRVTVCLFVSITSLKKINLLTERNRNAALKSDKIRRMPETL